VRHWTFGTPTARSAKEPTSEGKELPFGVPFVVVAQGNLGGQLLLASGSPDGDELSRLSSIKFLVPAKGARNYDTRVLLPPELVGERVLAPISSGNEELVAFTVVEEKAGDVWLSPIGKQSKIKFRKADLRSFFLPHGTVVSARIGNAWKTGTISDGGDDERVMVRVNGFDSPVKIEDLKIKRSSLPPLPKD
jgi:hypothetical protein